MAFSSHNIKLWGCVNRGDLVSSWVYSVYLYAFYLVVEDAHCVQSVEVLLQQGCSSRIQVDFIQLQHSYCHPEQSFVHGRLLQTHRVGLFGQ